MEETKKEFQEEVLKGIPEKDFQETLGEILEGTTKRIT